MSKEPTRRASSPGQDRAADLLSPRTLEIPVSVGERPARKVLALTVMAGRSVGQAFPLDRPEIIIGRADDAQVLVQDDGVSRRHAKLAASHSPEHAYHLSDLGSTNGTYLNDVQVRGAVPLSEGDSIRVGPFAILRYGLRDELDERLRERLYDLATRDPLTQAFNRRAFDERLLSEWAWAQRHKQALALCSLDADHFKRVNDTWGHAAGDFVLRQLADVVRAQLRTEDFFARVGGEEFYVLARSTPRPQAGIVGERLRAAMEARAFIWEKQRIPVTISVGVVTSMDPGIGATTELLKQADANLYAAKQTGRNRVVGGSGS